MTGAWSPPRRFLPRPRWQGTWACPKPRFYKQGAFNYFVREDIEKWLLRNRIASADELDRQAAAYVVTGKADAGRRARTPRAKTGKGGEK